MRDVHSRIDSGAPRRGQRRRIIVRKRIRVDGEPISQKGDAVAEVEAAGAFAGIVSRSFILNAGHAEVAANQPVQSNRQSSTSKNHGAAESEFQISCGLETELFSVKKRPWGSLVSLQGAEKHVPAHRPKKLEKAR